MNESIQKYQEEHLYTPPKREEYIDVSHNTIWEWLGEDIDTAIGDKIIQANYTGRSLGQKIVSHLKAEDCSIKDIQGLEIISEHIVIHTNLGKNLIYKLSKNKVKPVLSVSRDDLLKQESEKRKQEVLSLSKKQKNLEHVLGLMESIFTKNDSEIFGFINEKDTVKIDLSDRPWSDIPELQEKSEFHLTDLQKIVKSMLADIQKHRGSLSEKYLKDIDDAIIKSEEKYLDYIVGIGDKYEGGAGAFHSDANGKENVTQEEIEVSVKSIVAKKSIPELFNYMLEKHREIEANDFQSTEVTRTYSFWNRSLNSAVLEKMKKENCEDKVFLQYAKIVSGRDVPELATEKGLYYSVGKNKQKLKTRHSLDTNLLDPNSASEAILYVFQKPGGIMEKISEKVNLVDPIIDTLPKEQSNPYKIALNSASLIEDKLEGFQEAGKGKSILKKSGFQSAFNLNPKTPYKDLSIEEKMKISILIRLSKKIEKYPNIPKKSTSGKKVINALQVKDFGNLFIEVAEEGQQAVIDSFNDTLDGGGFFEWNSKESDDFGLTGTDAKIFDLYNDIWGNGFLNPSDFSIERYKSIGQFGVIIIGSIVAAAAAGFVLPVLVGSSVAMFTTAAMAGVVISNIAVPEGYDNGTDMSINIATDIAIAFAFGLIGGKMTERTFNVFSESGKKWVSKEGLKHAGSMGIDLGIFGLGTELARNFFIRNEDIRFEGLGIDIHNGLAIEKENRFSYEQFHSYVKIHLKDYLPKPGLS